MTIAKHSLFVAAALACAAASAQKVVDKPYASPEAEKLVRSLAIDNAEGRLIDITSTDLTKAYNANEVSADNKYKGKALRVDAVVDTVAKDMFGNIVVQIRAVNPYMPNIAALAKTVSVIDGFKPTAKAISMQSVPGPEAATMVNKGDKVRLVCKGGGFIIGAAQLRDCSAIYRWR